MYIFKSFSNRIVFYVTTSSILLSLILAVFSVSITFSNQKKDYINRGIEAIYKNTDSFTNSMDNIRYSLGGLSKRADIIEYTKTGTINRTLNTSMISIVNNYSAVSNLCLYSVNHNNNYTIPSGTGFNNYVQLNDYQSDENINGFFNSDDLFFYSIRKSNIATHYDFARYDANFGIISIIYKIFSNDILTGYIFADFRPSSVLNQYFNFHNYSSFSAIRTYLFDKNGDILSQGQTELNKNDDSYINSLTKSQLEISRHFVIKETVFEQYQVVSIIPLTSVYSLLNKVILNIVIVWVIAIIIVFIGSKLFTKNISTNIQKLKLKMKRVNID